MDSLYEKYFNKYCKEGFEKLYNASSKEPEIIYIGENYVASDICNCDSSSHYIMYTTFCESSYPFICGDCKNSVPLYKFPKTFDSEEYFDILGWERVYKACDTQFINGIGERHGYKMMNNPKSALSKEGLEICRYLEEKTNKPFYYFLLKYYRKNKPNCPSCNNPWENSKDEYNYDYVCHSCRLVSNDIGS
jgi:predicted  nucleic acid-binding Zn ribbon protein